MSTTTRPADVDPFAYASRLRSSALPCFECGLPAFHDHLVIPARLGGTKVVPLCPGCLRKLNDRAFSHPERTRAGLRAYRDRGGKVGAELPQCRNLTAEDRARGVAKSAAVRAAGAVEAYGSVGRQIVVLRARGMSLQDIAERLNFDGRMTRRGKPWNKVQVSRVLSLLERTPSGDSVMKIADYPRTLPLKEQYTTTEVAILYGMNVRSAAKMIDSGEIVGHRLPGSRDRRVLRSSILAHVEKNTAYAYVLTRMIPPEMTRASDMCAHAEEAARP